MSSRIPLTILPRLMRERGYAPPKYRDCYDAAVSALIPADREDNGRWTFDPADIDVIADRLGGRRYAA